MTTDLNRFFRSAAFILSATAIINAVAIKLGQKYIADPKDWPGWVQAIGSIEAILVAVWVSWQQSESQRAREIEKEKDELHGLLRAIRTEVETSATHARKSFGSALGAVSANNPYLSTVPISEDPFDIYNAALPRLGLIRDQKLRDQIVLTYAMAKGFVLTLRYHNELVAAYEQAQLQYQVAPSAATQRVLAVKANEVGGYSPVLRNSYHEMSVEVDTLLPQLATY